MKKLNKYLPYLRAALPVLVVAFLVLVVGHTDAWAASGASDPFDKATTKGNDLLALLQGKIAIVITSIVLAVVGILMLMQRINHLMGVRILIGTLVIGSAATIAEWMYS